MTDLSPSETRTKAEIEDVSDTALWVASCRAAETDRPDALFRDPLSGVLAGERGRRIAESMPRTSITTWVMAIRTVAIDQLIQDALDLGVDTVVNLGAGLDTRPYRMRLPAELHWIEVDFPHVIELKNRKLKAERPSCRLERIAQDLSDGAARKELFAAIEARSKCVLIITEGVIPYLSNEEAASLARDLAAFPRFRFWIQDYYRGNPASKLPKSFRKKLKSAPMRFDNVDWFGFFGQHGWRPRKKLTTFDESKRIGRPFPFIFPWSLLFLVLFIFKPGKYRDLSGYSLLEPQAR